VTKDGRTIICEWYNTPITDRDGKVVRIASLVDDVTERRAADEAKSELEAQLLHAQKMESVGRLAGGLAHDFNNTLSVIMGNAEFLMMKYRDADSFEGGVAKAIIGGVKRGAHLISQLMGFARRGKFQPVPLDLNSIIQEVVNISEKMFEKNITMQFTFNASLPPVKADKTQMHQILMNLVINAIDAMPGGGMLSLKTEYAFFTDESSLHSHPIHAGEYVKVSVTDTGTGMPKDVLDKIFEPFFTTKELGKGTGLGLAMVYGIIKNHDGYIFCKSEPGNGTSFTIYLPVSKDEVVEEKIDNSPIRGDATILVVDDEPTYREMLQQMLESLGFSVITAEDGEQAVSIYTVQKESIDLVLLDMIMPNMAGVDTYRELQKLNSAVRVLLISGFSQDERTKEILEDGVLDFLQKPFEMYELSKAVNEALTGE
jgi:two-component system, cell cycle sensor histidine kinase and response regulator CckA